MKIAKIALGLSILNLLLTGCLFVTVRTIVHTATEGLEVEMRKAGKELGKIQTDIIRKLNDKIERHAEQINKNTDNIQYHSH